MWLAASAFRDVISPATTRLGLGGGQAGGDRNVKLNPGGEGVNKIVKSNETNAGARALGTNDISYGYRMCFRHLVSTIPDHVPDYNVFSRN